MRQKIWQLINLCLMTSSAVIGLEALLPSDADAATLWNTLSPNPAQAFSSQSNGAIPSETADDFFLLNSLAPNFEVEGFKINGLFSASDAKIDSVRVELYRSFPIDSDATRTTNIVRLNGPADNAFAKFASGDGSLSYKVTDKGDFKVNNRITPGSTTALGSLVDEELTGNLRQIDITLTDPIVLTAAASPADQANHYFLAASVETSQGDYYWLAGEPPITTGDRQAWLRTDPFAPDWIRASDIINGESGTLRPAFNASFEVSGQPVPEPSTALGTLALGGIALSMNRLRKRSA